MSPPRKPPRRTRRERRGVERYVWLATVLGLERTVRAIGIVAERLEGRGFRPSKERRSQEEEEKPLEEQHAFAAEANAGVLVFSDVDAARAARAMNDGSERRPSPALASNDAARRSSSARASTPTALRPALPRNESIRGALRRTEAAAYVGLSPRAF